VVDVCCDHEDSRRALAGDEVAPAEEQAPDAVPTFAIFFDYFFTIGAPVLVPFEDCDSVVYTTILNAMDFKTGAFKLVNNPIEWAGCICARENIAVHEQPPDKVLVLPAAAKASYLQIEDAVFLEQCTYLVEESLVVLDTNVLRHLKASDSIIFFRRRDFAIVFADPGYAVLYSLTLGSILRPINLFLGQRDACGMRFEVLCSMTDESAPSAANIQVLCLRFQLHIFAYGVHFTLLCLLKRFLLGIYKHSRGINHHIA
jgi:hypothetical protein